MKRFGLYPELPTFEDSLLCGSENGEPKEWILIGKLSEYGKQYPVHFDITKEKVIAIFGKRGQGKSYTLGSFIEGLCTSEKETQISSISKNRGVLVFDTLNIFQWTNVSVNAAADQSAEMKSQAALLKAWSLPEISLDVDIWVPAGYRYDMYPDLYRDLYIHVPDLTVDDWGSLLEIDIIRDIKGQFLSEIFNKVVNNGWTDNNGVEHSPNFEYSISDLVDCIRNDNDIEEYRSDTRRAILQQLLAYSKHPIFSESGTPLKELIKPGRASVILLNLLPEDLRGVLVSILIRRLLKERAEASEIAKDLMINPDVSVEQRAKMKKLVEESVPKTSVVIDEAQNLIPSSGFTSATRNITKFVKEGRNFGLSFIVTTQQPRALDVNILSQVETFIVHKLASQTDIEHILSNLKSPLPSEIKDGNSTISAKELIRDIGIGQALVSDTNTDRAFMMEIRPRVSAHGGFEA